VEDQPALPVAFNIETAANEQAREGMPKPDVKFGRTKDPAKKEEMVKEAREKQRQSLALDCNFGRVIAFSFVWKNRGNDERSSAVEVIKSNDDDGERELLAQLWKMVLRMRDAGRFLVTFNGSGFDIPFILRRSAAHRAPVPVHVETGKYRTMGLHSGFHCDLMRTLHESETSEALKIPHTLGFYVNYLLGESFPFDGLDQSTLGSLLEQENGRVTIETLCRWNSSQTLALYERLQQIYP